jgi:hypothetical protein
VTRKALSGVEYRHNWTSLAGCLESLLAFEGAPLPRPDLMVLTGFAFRLRVRTSGRLLAGSALNEFEPKDLAARLSRLGLEFEVVASGEIRGPDRDGALRLIRRAVDRGAPAIVYGLQLPEFGLVWGYDDKAETLAVKTVLSDMVGELLAWERYPAPEAHRQLVLALKKRRTVDPDAALADALSAAVDAAEGGATGDGCVEGLPAYEAWAGLLESAADLDPQGNAHTVQTLQAARADAAAFLSNRQEEALRAAAAAYKEEVLELYRHATLFPFPAGGDVTNPAVRRLAAATLRQALVHERRAVEALDRSSGR